MAGLRIALVLALALRGAVAQVVDQSALETVLSGYTGGSGGKPSDNYLTTLATTLTNGFVTSIGSILNDTKALKNVPETYADLIHSLKDDMCTDYYVNKSSSKPATIVGPEIDISFTGGACLLNNTDLFNGDVNVECVAPAVTVDILPAKLTSPYTTAVKFTDEECKMQKTFGNDSDNVVFVLDKGVFNISGLVDQLQTGLASVLGEVSSLAGSVVAAPAISPIIQTVNTATALLG